MRASSLRLLLSEQAADTTSSPTAAQLLGCGPARVLAHSFRTRERVKGQQGYGYAIDIGSSTAVPEVKQLGITSVQSAVSRYDELLALIAHWPVTTNEWPSRWPAQSADWSNTSEEEIHFTDNSGGDYFFCLKRSDKEASK